MKPMRKGRLLMRGPPVGGLTDGDPGGTQGLRVECCRKGRAGASRQGYGRHRLRGGTGRLGHHRIPAAPRVCRCGLTSALTPVPVDGVPILGMAPDECQGCRPKATGRLHSASVPSSQPNNLGARLHFSRHSRGGGNPDPRRPLLLRRHHRYAVLLPDNFAIVLSRGQEGPG